MKGKQPIRVFWSPLSERFYASRKYRIKDGVAVIHGEKFDVTQDIARAVVENGIEFQKIEKREAG